MKINPGLIGVVVIAVLSVALVKSCSDANSLQSDNDAAKRQFYAGAGDRHPGIQLQSIQSGCRTCHQA